MKKKCSEQKRCLSARKKQIFFVFFSFRIIFILNILLSFSVSSSEANQLEKCNNILYNNPSLYQYKDSKLRPPNKELIILNGINTLGSGGLIDSNYRIIAPGNQLGFSLQVTWSNKSNNSAWWDIRQKISPGLVLNDYDRIAFDIYPLQVSNTTHLRIFLEESDGDRWVVLDIPFQKNSIKIREWNHFEVKRSDMIPWLLGDQKLNWLKIDQLAIEPWSLSLEKEKTTFLIDNVKLLGTGQSFEVFNTRDDGDKLEPILHEIQSLSVPGTAYLAGLGYEQHRDNPQKFQKLLGRIGTSHAQGLRLINLVKSGIPVIGYSGLTQGYEKFLTRREAWDVNAAGEGPGSIPFPLKSFTFFHTIALAHTGVAEALQKRIDGFIRSGIGIFMAVDYTFPWREGPFGYSEAMRVMYRRDLKGLDAGLSLNDGNKFKIIHFPDYFRMYNGFFPNPSDLNLLSWDYFDPPLPAENRINTRAFQRIFMLLRSYEWLKLADRTGRYMQCRGGHGLWVMPNPEDSIGSSDYVMLLRTSGVTNVFPEWFGDIAGMSAAAYKSGPYLREQANRGKSRLSVLFEAGVGGHSKPYWDWQVAFNGSYSLTAATQADDFNNDFVDQAPFHQISNSKNPTMFRRFRDTISKALGFQLARQLQAKRLSSRILSVSDRPPGKAVSSFFFTTEDNRRPGLSGSLWRTHSVFDMRDSLELDQVLNRYDIVVYDSIAPKVGDMDKLKRWLEEESGRVLITHSFIPTRDSRGYWDSDSGTKFGSIQNPLVGFGSLVRTNITSGIVTDLAEAWKPFLSIGQKIQLSEPLSKSASGKSLVMTSAGALVSEAVVGKSKVIYFHYTPGISDITRQLDSQLTVALMNYLKHKSLVVANPEVSIQTFQIPGGQSVVAWDMVSASRWTFKNEPDSKPLHWIDPQVNQRIRIKRDGKPSSWLIYDFWADQVSKQSFTEGFVDIYLKSVSSKIFFIGKNSNEFNKTIESARSTRKKMKSLHFDAPNIP